MRNMNKNKKAVAISLLLMLTIIITTLSGVSAQQWQTTGRTRQPGAYLAVGPNPVGIGQSVQVTFWVEPTHPLPNDVFQGYAVKIVHPDGTVENKGPYTSLGRQSIQFFTYQPTSEGNYTFEFTYAGQTFSSTNDTYLPATAQIVTLMVQADPIPYYPLNPLPTEYWTRPIDAQNTNWAAISGSWLMRGGNNGSQVGYGDSWGGYNPYTTAPSTAHIMWTEQMNLGGLVGGDITGSIYSGATYNPFLAPPVIMGGLAFYGIRNYGAIGYNSRLPGVQAVDLRTGEIQWINPDMKLTLGQVYHRTAVSTQSGMGSRAYLWGNTRSSTWNVYDAYTGELIINIARRRSCIAP